MRNKITKRVKFDNIALQRNVTIRNLSIIVRTRHIWAPHQPKKVDSTKHLQSESTNKNMFTIIQYI